MSYYSWLLLIWLFDTKQKSKLLSCPLALLLIQGMIYIKSNPELNPSLAKRMKHHVKQSISICNILSAIVFFRHNRFVHRSHREHYWTWRWSPQGNWKPPLIAMWRPRRIVVGCCCRDKCSKKASCVYLQIEQHFNLLKKYIHKHRM